MEIQTRCRQVKEIAAQYGRKPDATHIRIEISGSIDEDSKKAREIGLGTLAIGRSTFERLMTVDQLAEVSLIGSPEEIRRTVRAYSDAGVTHFEIKFIYPTLERHAQMLELFAREVLPAFR